MSLREEAEFNFAKDVDNVLSTVGKVAKSAFDKFTSAKKKAQDDLKRDAVAQAKAAVKADKQAKKSSDPKAGSNQPVEPALRTVARDAKSLRIIIANFLVGLEEAPRPEDMAAFADLDASEFQDLIKELVTLERELDDFPKNYKSLLKGSGFLTAPQKSADTLDLIVQPLDNPGVYDKQVRAVNQNPQDLHTVLQGVLIDPTLQRSGKPILNWLNARNENNKRVNLARSGGNLATDVALARHFNGYVMQVMLPWVEKTIVLAQDAENKPITQEHLKNIRDLLKRL